MINFLGEDTINRLISSGVDTTYEDDVRIEFNPVANRLKKERASLVVTEDQPAIIDEE